MGRGEYTIFQNRLQSITGKIDELRQYTGARAWLLVEYDDECFTNFELNTPPPTIEQVVSKQASS